MTPEELAKVVAKAEPDFGRERMITSRRYNLVIFKMRDGEKEILETIEYLTLRQARELKAEYLSEDNLYSDIIEDITTDRDGNELTFPARNSVPEVKGLGGFGTPEATERIIERQRNARRNKASFKIAASRAESKQNRKENLYEPEDVAAVKKILSRAPGYNENSELHEMYLDNVKRNGYTLIDKHYGRVYQGMQNEICDAILFLIEIGRNVKNELDISFNGV